MEARTKRYRWRVTASTSTRTGEGEAEAGHIPSGFFTGILAYDDSLKRIEKLGGEVIPSHDPLVVEHREFR